MKVFQCFHILIPCSVQKDFGQVAATKENFLTDLAEIGDPNSKDPAKLPLGTFAGSRLR
jgi:hypothetical protein